jgi:3-oxoacyl-[acyl-carrier-protein] synthase II
VLGEGAGILVLETEEHATARGANVYGRVLGAGMSNDAYHVAQPDPSGAGAARAMRMALDDARVAPRDIVHINAHATSTPQGDLAEAGAIRAVLGDAAAGAAVSATKSMTGHLLGAAGAVEAIAAVLACHPQPRRPRRRCRAGRGPVRPAGAAHRPAAPRAVELVRLRGPQRRARPRECRVGEP